MKYIAERLRELRKKTGKNQEEIAMTLGISAATLSRIENDPKDSKMIHIKKLADYYDISLERLFSLDEYKIRELRKNMSIQILYPSEINSAKFFFELAKQLEIIEKIR
ncbi:MAG: helix-turn-helix transcriptional regulator [Flavobacteriaceae bacterium]|nr:helix-turn-helix transcriptional regulator [Flavobacteriaceae bacterium]